MYDDINKNACQLQRQTIQRQNIPQPICPLPEYVVMALQKLGEGGATAYIVGGCVRDSLLGTEPKDYDITTSARPREIVRLFHGYKIVASGIKHGTVAVAIGGRLVEITTYRTEGSYSDHRRPDSVSFTDNIEGDLSRRDFTVNAMAYSLESGLVDPFDGARDLRDSVLCAVGDPDARFSILRGVRFAAVYDLEPEPATASAMIKNAELLKNISAERIYTELVGTIDGEYAEKYLYKFRQAYAHVLPEFMEMASRPDSLHGDALRRALAVVSRVGTVKFISKVKPEPVWLRLAALFREVGEDREISAKTADNIMRRLKTDRLTRENTVALIREPELMEFSRAAIRRFIAKLSPERAAAFLKLHIAAAETAGEIDKASDYRHAHGVGRVRVAFGAGNQRR